MNSVQEVNEIPDAGAQMRAGMQRSCLTFVNRPQSVNKASALMSNNPQALKKIHAAFQKNLEWPQHEVIFIGFVDDPPNQSAWGETVMSREDKKKFVIDTVTQTFTNLLNLRLKFVPDGWDIAAVNLKQQLNQKPQMRANVADLRKRGLSDEQIDKEINNIANDVSRRVPVIRISFAVEGAYSYVGTTNLQEQAYDALRNPGRTNETMGLGWLDENLQGGVVKHEFGHMIGLMHEHQRPDAKGADKLDFVDSAVLTDFFKGPPNYWDDNMIENNVFKTFEYTTLNASVYDPKSIMHYILDCNMFKDHRGPPGLACTTPMCPEDPAALAEIKRNMPDYQCSNSYDIVNNTQVLSDMDKQTIKNTYPPAGYTPVYDTTTVWKPPAVDTVDKGTRTDNTGDDDHKGTHTDNTNNDDDNGTRTDNTTDINEDDDEGGSGAAFPVWGIIVIVGVALGLLILAGVYGVKWARLKKQVEQIKEKPALQLVSPPVVSSLF